MSDPFDVIFAVVRSDRRDFTARQVAILRLVQMCKRPEDRQIKALSDALGVSRAVTSRAADKLEQDGLVERSELKHDARTCVLTLTARGKALMSEIAGESGRQAA